jgi:hypothetical protein
MTADPPGMTGEDDSSADLESEDRLFMKQIDEFGRALQLPEGFLGRLLVDDDDWSFVLKAHALLESAVCAWLAAYLQHPELEESLAADVEMSSRINLMSALGIGTKAGRRSMPALSNLRNDVAHSAKGTQFTFRGHLSNPDRRKHVIEKFDLGKHAHGATESVDGLKRILRVEVWGPCCVRYS